MRPTALEYDRYVALVDFGRERGWDHSRIAVENPFQVADVGLTMILLRADRDLLALAGVLGREDDARDLRERIALAEQGIEWLWNEEVGAYGSRDLLTGEPSGFITSASFLSFYAGLKHPDRDARLLGHLDRIGARIKYLTPSLDPADPDFDMMRYWRGPVWAVVNYMISQGLAETGHDAMAERVRSDTRDLIQTSGFYEAFDPTSGAPTGGDDFSWTAAIWLCWAGRG